MDYRTVLADLVETPGVSGDEHRIRDVITDYVDEYADSVATDDLGNLLVRKGSGDFTVMLVVHMDQIGLTVQRIDDDGFIHFSKVGGVTTQSLLNQRVTIHTDDGEVTGVIGMKPPHVKDKEQRDELPDKDDLFIDIGAEDDEAAAATGVHVGDYITFDRGFATLQDDYVTGAAFDNRVGCLIGIDAVQRFDEDYELVVVFSTQEEVGLKGAKTAAFGIDPDVALAVDTSIAGDVPRINDGESDLSTGDGVEITMMQSEGRGLITPEPVRDWLVETAEEYDHDYHRGVWEGGATDAANVYLVREGIPTGSLGIPTRHIHSATEVVKLSDIEETADFVQHALATVDDYFSS